MKIVINKSLRLQTFEPRDATELFGLIDANRLYLREWLPWLDGVVSVDDTRTFIQSTIEAQSGGGELTFAIVFNNEIVGVIRFFQCNTENRNATIGYWLSESATGRGVVTQAVAALIDLGFNEYSLNRIEIRCAVLNSKSRAVPQRLGFIEDGTLRQAEWLYTKFVDLVIYSMLASDYQGSKE